MPFVKKPRLLDFKSSPPHLQFNDCVLTGYRPVSTVKGCLHSLFYLHNEFGNIYTHGKSYTSCRIVLYSNCRKKIICIGRNFNALAIFCTLEKCLKCIGLLVCELAVAVG